jgi:hypothetical protein
MNSREVLFISPKNDLQEYCQYYKLPLPKYITTKMSGSAHEPQFRSVCNVTLRPELRQTLGCETAGTSADDTLLIAGEFCTRKKCAELSAAEKMLRALAEAEDSAPKGPRTVERFDFAGDSLYEHLYESGDVVPRNFFLWDVENYKLTFKLKEFEPCVMFAIDSDGSDSTGSVQTALGSMSHPDSRVIQITSPTRLQDGADVAIIWMIAQSGGCPYLRSTNCVILSRDKLFCTVKDICDSWHHGFQSVTLITT